MYRGSSFLLQRTYTVHRNVVECIADPRFDVLWNREITGLPEDSGLARPILDLVLGIRRAYQPFGAATDTLVTKVIMGTVGCLPACDRFFVDGFKRCGYSFSSVNPKFVNRILGFCVEHQPELSDIQNRIEQQRGVRYPFMKLADMHFWQIGYDASL